MKILLFATIIKVQVYIYTNNFISLFELLMEYICASEQSNQAGP
jgi:hypothetical protein